MQDGRRNQPRVIQPRHLFNQRLAQYRMFPDHRPFIDIERTRLVHHRLRQLELADVVIQRGPLQRVQFRIAQQPAGHAKLHRDMRDARTVLEHFAIHRIDRAREQVAQGCDHRLVDTDLSAVMNFLDRSLPPMPFARHAQCHTFNRSISTSTSHAVAGAASAP